MPVTETLPPLDVSVPPETTSTPMLSEAEETPPVPWTVTVPLPPALSVPVT